MGVPVCTVEVSGMREILGTDKKYGVITENQEDALYEGVKELIADPKKLEYYRCQAIKRGKSFGAKKTVRAVEDMLQSLLEG